MNNNLSLFIKKLKDPSGAAFLSYTVVLLVGLFDYITNPEFSFSLFYLIPITYNTWYSSRKNGIFISVFSAVTWLYVDLSSAQYENQIAPFWNMTIRLGFFMTVVFLLSEIKFLYRNLENMVDVRTNELSDEIKKKITAEAELRRAKNLYQDLVENINEVYYTTDELGYFKYISPNFYKNVKLSGDYLKDKTFYDLISQEDVYRVQEFYSSKINENASDGICEFRIIGNNSITQWFEQTSRIIRDNSGKPVEIRNLLRNIDERKAAEISLIKSEMNFQRLFSEGREELSENDYIRKMLQTHPGYLLKSLAERIDDVSEKISHRIRQALGFSSLASHELRTPLAIIRNQLEENLREDTKLNDLKETTASIYDEVLRLQRIIGDLLNLSKMETGKIKLKKETVILDSLLRSFYEEASLLAQAKNIIVKLDGRADIRIDIDRSYFLQLLFNIFDNALKFTPENGSILISSSCNNNEVTVSVSDTGRGIPPETINKLFQFFYRDSSDTSTGGTGLGLIISKWIAELHNGRIEIKSEVGKGTSLLIILPCK